MLEALEQLFVGCANRLLLARERRPADGPGVLLGHAASDTSAPGAPVWLADAVRPEHIAILGKTGSGKTSLMRVMSRDDVRRDHGFVHIDLHGDTTPYLLRVLAAEERRRQTDLSSRVILIDPSDPHWAVGLNVLNAHSDAERFVQLAEVARLLKERWDLASFGPRTEELLRSALFALSAAQLTLVELGPFLTDSAFRASSLEHVQNRDVRAYFRDRYDVASEPMQGVLRDAVLNKVTAFTTDPHFRHILGQRHSGLPLVEALDGAYWVVLHLPKGRLGEHAATLGSLFLTYLKRALFARLSRSLVTVYADELQNLVEYTGGIDTLLAEARKFGIGFCSANQFLEQYPAAMRAAILAVGTHVFFQLSAQDAERANALIGGGRSVQHLLKELPARQALIRRGGERWRHMHVRDVDSPQIDPTDLIRRVHERWARRREELEQEIDDRVRRPDAHGHRQEEDLDDWR